MNGKIIKIISNLYTVKVNGKIIEVNARGKFRNDKLTPLVGDDCKVDVEKKYILEIEKRKNKLSRPPVANVDIALIVTSVKEPDLSLNLLDKLLCIININKIIPIIVFTKLDLLDNNEKKKLKKIRKYYESIGIKTLDNKNVRKIKKELKKKVAVVTGQSGAGKSTLLNKINKNLNLQTQEISKALGRGKHTTRHVELFEIGDFYIVDTPGFSALDINDYSKEQIRDSFIEFKTYECDFKNCMHLNEQKCSIKDAVLKNKILNSRYENYKNFVKEK